MSTSQQVRKKDIAIIGMSGVFPKSEDLNQLWEHLIRGEELVHFYQDKELRQLGVPEDLLLNERYVKANSLINHSEYFDYAFFGYTQEEAEIMDPQIRIMHQQVWLALEDAGYNPQHYLGKIGLYLSASDNLNWRAQTLLNPSSVVGPFMSARLSDKNFISTLISYNLNLKGPSYYSNTACSSSLTAIHIACRNLLMQECSMAIAGAASIITNSQRGYLYEEDMIFSVDGHSRVFDRASTGTIFGEGAGVVVLKRLNEAIRDKDHIYAVIRGSAVNNDGNSKVGYTAPSIVGQAECIRMAHQFADVSPASIRFVEAHGTATKLGDPIEIEALNQAFKLDSNQSCFIGSIKSNLGHLDTVAGIVGLIKATLALQNRLLPPSINYKASNPEINFAEGPFTVNAELTPLKPHNEERIRAGVSSFGIGGTNAHIVMEEWMPAETRLDWETKPQLLVFSAKTRSALKNYCDQFAQFLRGRPGLNWLDLAYTLQTGRRHFPHRTTLVCSNQEEALRHLEQTDITHAYKNLGPATVFMFAGGGSQYYRMGFDLYQNEPFFQKIMDRGFRWLKQKTGEDFKRIIGYVEDATVDQQRVNEIKYMLPIIFMVEYALAELLRKIGVHPTYLIGHSLGEYTAAAISGVFTFEDALYLVLRRGTLSATLHEGGMLGVELSADEIKPYLSNTGVSIATINMEDACVVSGPAVAIKDLSEILQEQEIGYTRVKISIAAHSPMLDVILEDYRKALQEVSFAIPQIPFISNLSGQEITSEEATSVDYWIRHLRHTVNFLGGIRYLLKKGDANYIEIGSGGILSSFLKQNHLYTEGTNFSLNILRHPKETENDHQYYLKSLGKLWQHGTEIDWVAFQNNQVRQNVPLPGYAFDKTELPVRVDPLEQIKNEGLNFNLRADGQRFGAYFSNWKRSVRFPGKADSKKSGIYLLYTDGNEVATWLKEQLAQNNRIVEIRSADKYTADKDFFTIDPYNGAHYERLFKQLSREQITISQVVYIGRLDNTEDVLKPSISLLHFCQQLLIHQLESVRTFSLITAGAVSITHTELLHLSVALAELTSRVILQNNAPSLCCNFIDLETLNWQSSGDVRLLNDLLYHSSDKQIAYRGRDRWVHFYERIFSLPKEEKIDQQLGSYVIINGLEAHARALTDQFAAYFSDLAIIGLLSQEALATNGQADYLDQIGKHLGQINYYQCDTSDLTSFQQTLKAIEKAQGKIRGIIYFPEEAKSNQIADLHELIAGQYQKFLSLNHLRTLVERITPDFVWVPLRLSSASYKMTDYVYQDTFAKLIVRHEAESKTTWVCLFWDDLDSQFSASVDMPTYFRLASALQLDQLLLSSLNPNLSTNHQRSNSSEASNQYKEVSPKDLLENYVPPTSQQEKELCDLWHSFLGFETLGTADNFFELGGNSLKAVTLLKRIQQKYNVQITLKDFYANPTVYQLAQEIEIVRLLKTQKEKTDSKVLKI